MQRAEPPYQIDCVNTHDSACGEKLGQPVQGDSVVAVIEGGNYYDVVCNVEVGIAGRQSFTLHYDRPWKWQRNYAQLAGERTGGLLQSFQIILHSAVVFVRGIVFPGQYDGLLIYEARDVVHVAVRVVADAPSPSQMVG